MAALGVSAALGAWWWRSSESQRARDVRANAHGAEGPERPYRCARVGAPPLTVGPEESASADAGAEPVSVAGASVSRSGYRAKLTRAPAESSNRPLILGVVADARGVIQHLPTIRDQFERRGVTLVVSLGGMGRTRAQIEAALSALTGPWFLLASPGDWESLADHRAAVRALAPRGVLDGTAVRVLGVDGHTLATWPGAPSAGRTVAGEDGCAFIERDTERLPELFSDASGVRLLASHTPPRQAGPGATDNTRAGVNIGDRALARASARAGVAVLIHGLLARERKPPEAPIPTSSSNPVILAAGAADGIIDLTTVGKWPPLAAVITIEAGSVTWEYLRK